MKNRIKIFLVILMSFFLVACKSNVKVSLNQSNLSLLVGDTYTLEVSLSKNKDVNLKWESSNQDIIIVNDEGEVVAVALGNAVVSVEVVESGNKATCAISVKEVRVDSIFLSKEINRLDIDKQIQLVASVSPSNSTNKNMIWESSDNNIASVSETGLLSSFKPGVVTIMVTSEDGNFFDTILITVDNVNLISVVIQGQTPRRIFIGDSIQFVVDKNPNNYYGDLIWSSSSTSFCEITQDGLFSSFGVGTTTVKVRDESGDFFHQVDVIISPIEAESIQVERQSITIDVGNFYNINAEVVPSNSSFRDLTYISSDPDVVSVSLTGKLKSLKEGFATITIMVLDTTVTTQIYVTAKNVEAQSIEIVESVINIYLDDSVAIQTILLPVNTTNKSLNWSSDQPSIASVNQFGVVVGVSIGQTIIRVSIGEVDDFVTVNVHGIDVEGIGLSHTFVRMGINSTQLLGVVISPQNATNKNVVFTSSNNDVASVDKFGLVTANLVGSATISATTIDGEFISSCEIEVFVSEVIGVSIENNSSTLYIGEELLLSFNVYPSNAINKQVIWESSDDLIAFVEDGLITAISEGEVVITVRTVDGNYSTTYNLSILVVQQEGKIISSTNRFLYLGESLHLVAEFKIVSDEDYVVWSSSDELVAFVDQEGIVTTRGIGFVTIGVLLNDSFLLEYEIEVKEENQVMTVLYEKVVKNTVSVISFDSSNHEKSSGSGFVYKEDETHAYIYTNAHVVSKYVYFEVMYYNKVRQTAQLLYFSDAEDVAILKVIKSSSYEVATLGDSDLVKVGETIFTIGSPLGITFAGNMSSGIVSGVNIIMKNQDESLNLLLLQIDASLNPGNSGGPLYNLRGEVIGVNTLKLKVDNNGNPVQLFNYALPINFFDFIGETLIEKGSYIRPFAGLTLVEIQAMNLSERVIKGIDVDIHTGLYIESFTSPYDDVNVPIDTIITAFNGTEVATMKDFLAQLLKFNVGEVFTISLIYPSGMSLGDYEITLYL